VKGDGLQGVFHKKTGPMIDDEDPGNTPDEEILALYEP
jgi:hypothetical protein